MAESLHDLVPQVLLSFFKNVQIKYQQTSCWSASLNPPMDGNTSTFCPFPAPALVAQLHLDGSRMNHHRLSCWPCWTKCWTKLNAGHQQSLAATNQWSRRTLSPSTAQQPKNSFVFFYFVSAKIDVFSYVPTIASSFGQKHTVRTACL